MASFLMGRIKFGDAFIRGKDTLVEVDSLRDYQTLRLKVSESSAGSIIYTL